MPIIPQTIGILTKVFCILCPNKVVLVSIGVKFLQGQAQNGVHFDFGVQFDLQGQSQSPHKTIKILTELCFTSGAS